MAYNAALDINAFVNEAWLPGVVDQLGEMSSLVKILMQSNGLTNMDANKPGLSSMITGGDKIKKSVRHTRTASRGSVSGYDILAVDPNRKFDHVSFEWRTYYDTLPQSLDEMLAARGMEAVNNWMDAHLSVMVGDLMDLVSTGVYNSVASRVGLQIKGLNGLRQLTDTTRPWGTIDSTAYAWWEPGFHDAANHTIAEVIDPTSGFYILDLIVDLINGCTHNGKRPTHIMVTEDMFDLIERTMRLQKIYRETSTADIGYEFLKYRGIQIVSEHGDYMPAGFMFAFNDKKLKLTGREGAWFKLTNWREPSNQLARVRFLVAQCCLYNDEPCTTGCYTDIAAA